MRKLVLSGILVVLLVAALATGITGAFFSDAANGGNVQTTMASLKVGGTSGFPLTFTALAPGAPAQSQVGQVWMNANVQSQIYFGLQAVSGDDLKTYLEARVYGNGRDTGWVAITNLFGAWQDGGIVAAGDTGFKDYTVEVRVPGSVGNAAQGKSATAFVCIYATQEGQPAPAGAVNAPWQYACSPTS